MATITAVWDALADTLADIISEIPDLNISQGQFVDLTPPALEVYPGEPPDDEGAGFGPDTVFDWTVRARVSSSDSSTQQVLLAQLMEQSGPTSIDAVLTADQTLGGVVETLNVVRETGFRQDSAGGGLIWATWRVTVYNTPTEWS